MAKYLDRAGVSFLTQCIANWAQQKFDEKQFIMKGGTGITIAGDGITINHTNVVNSGTVTGGVGTSTTNGGKFTMPRFSFDNEGHLTSWDTVEVTLPLITASRDLEVSGNNIQHTTTIAAVTEHLGGSSDATLEFGNTFQIPYFKYSAYGHFTASGLRTITLPSYTVTESKNGLMSKEDKIKLNALNANAWYKVKVNTVDIEPDDPQDTLTIVQSGENISVSGNASTDTITISHGVIGTTSTTTASSTSVVNPVSGISVVTGVTKDANGHVSGITASLLKLIAGNGIAIDADGTIRSTLDIDVFKVVSSLPTTGVANKIYLVKNNSTEGAADSNRFTEWIYADGNWEKVGEFDPGVDISDELDDLLSASAGIKIVGAPTSFDIQHTNSVTAVASGSGVGVTTNATPGFGSTFNVPHFTYDAQGHITGSGTHTVTIPSSTAVAGGANGLMTGSDKSKLDGISSGAEVNQNAFAIVKVGSVNVEADAKQDTVEFVAGSGMSLTGDATNDKITFAHSNSVTAGSNIGGTSNLTPGFGGTATLVHFSYDAQGHITGSGTHNLTIPSTTASTTSNGLMTTTQVSKLNGIAEGATADSALTQNDILTRVNNALGTSYTTSTATWPSS